MPLCWPQWVMCDSKHAHHKLGNEFDSTSQVLFKVHNEALLSCGLRLAQLCGQQSKFLRLPPLGPPECWLPPTRGHRCPQTLNKSLLGIGRTVLSIPHCRAGKSFPKVCQQVPRLSCSLDPLEEAMTAEHVLPETLQALVQPRSTRLETQGGSIDAEPENAEVRGGEGG